ncbi:MULTISPECIES: alkaline phosphatase family protein [Haloarcula]|uniref:alkaline phosphatase family protein n=1 Tax=Haloarcula TaxID=2237 RepID=UPI0023E86E8E|nr:alkaline phosphatase family protein [Halomicroarcula sp. SHR3]
MSDEQTGAKRAFVLGLDGVPWGKLNDWIDEGHLPNFERLRASGVSSACESTMPPNTALAWPSIATGVWPDTHGVYGFRRVTSEYGHEMCTSRDVDYPTLWEQVRPAVVANVPMTYPATEIDGELVSGMISPEMNEQFTHPPALCQRIREEIPDYEIGLTWSEYTDRPEAFLAALEGHVTARRELMRLLMERDDWRLFFFVYTAPDRLQHLHWDETVLVDHYQTLDEILGEVMAYTEERGANLFVVSDHGFGPSEKRISVNRLLEREGYLKRRDTEGVRKLLASAGLQKDDVLSMLEAVGVTEKRLLRYLPDRLVETAARQVPGSHILFDVDFSRTQGFVHGSGCVYVNDTDRFENGVVDPNERDRVKTELAEVFSTYTDPDTGTTVLQVFDGDRLFEKDERSPDLIVRPVPGYSKAVGLNEQVVSPLEPHDVSANHRREGIFFAAGPSITPDTTLESSAVVDVAPTVLHSLGDPVPASADGQVLTNIFSTRTPVTRRAVATPEAADGDGTGDDFEGVEERLRGLGYLN